MGGIFSDGEKFFMIEKSEIRAAMRVRRKAVTPVARDAVGRALSKRLFAECPELGSVISKKGLIAVYLASKDEIDLADFISAAQSFGCTLVAPRWNGTEYELVKVGAPETLVKGPHGILEPPAGSVVRPEDVRAWLVPGLAFTKDGGRLGYGGGWYDRLLVKAPKRAVKIGIAYTFQLVDELPTEPHDIRLTSIVNCDDLADLKPLIVSPGEVERKPSFWTLKLGPDSRVADAAQAQLAARPCTWGVGLWPSDEVESVAKRCAEILTGAFQCASANLLPTDTMGGIHRLDYYGDLEDVDALMQIEEEFQCNIPTDKLQPEQTFAEFVELVFSERGKAVRPKKSHGPICHFLGKMCLWALIAIFFALPVIVPLDLIRRCLGAQRCLTDVMLLEMLILAVMICLFIDSRRNAPQEKRRRHWEKCHPGDSPIRR